MTQYFYPNEVVIVREDGVRKAYLKPDWQEIRKKNENVGKLTPAQKRDLAVPWKFWNPEIDHNYYWCA